MDKNYRGIKRIEIPKTEKDFKPENGFGLFAIKKYLPNIIATHNKNAEKEKWLYDYYIGLQEIYNKKRPYNKDAQTNNIVCENHAFRQVNFKAGFLTSDKRDYATSEGTQDAETAKDDITILQRYMKDVNFFGKDKEVKEWVYITGIGVTDVRPREDTIMVDEKGEYRFANEQDGFDIEYESPFEFNVLCPYENFVVYSSGRRKEPLFSVSFVEVETNPNDESDTSTHIEYQIETKWAIFTAKSDTGYSVFDTDIKMTEKKSNNIIPIVEHFAYSARIGLIEILKSNYDAINILVSAVEDMVVDNANAILVFKNTDVDSEVVEQMKAAGAIIINDNKASGGNAKADLDTIKVQIDFSGLNSYYEQRLLQIYDIAGVPLGSQKVSGGGNTGQALWLGEGYANAQTISSNEATSFLIADYQVLRQMIYICKLYPDCPMDKLNANRVEIKYKLNNSENFLTKAQGIKNLYDANMPKKMITKVSAITSDVDAWGDEWEEYDKMRLKEQAEQKIGTETNVPTTEQNGNNSQE